MCGRFNIIDDPLTKLTSQLLGLTFSAQSNSNVCPSESISTVMSLNNVMTQVNADWGIKPSWANRLIINAQAETVSTKKTFKQAFHSRRCVIPFSGWYEWQTQDNGTKQKYLFSNNSKVMFMAGIIFEQRMSGKSVINGDAVANNQLVTLTTQANQQCAPIHSRMPLLIPQDHLRQWLTQDYSALGELLNSESQLFEINTA